MLQWYVCCCGCGSDIASISTQFFLHGTRAVGVAPGSGWLDIAVLDKALLHYCEHGLADSMQRTYLSGLNAICRFVLYLGYSPFSYDGDIIVLVCDVIGRGGVCTVHDKNIPGSHQACADCKRASRTLRDIFPSPPPFYSEWGQEKTRGVCPPNRSPSPDYSFHPSAAAPPAGAVELQ